MYTVYKHTTPAGKVYIGLTNQRLAKRWGKDGAGYKAQILFYRAITKYGWENIKHEVIKEGLTRSEAAALEVELIALYDSTNPERGYNSSTGGDSGRAGAKSSEETKQKQSRALKGKPSPKKGIPLTDEHKKKLSLAFSGEKNHFFGKHHTAEANRRNAEAHKGKPSPRSKAVICLDTGARYLSAAEAGRALGLCGKSICANCSGKLKKTGGLHFAYIDDLQATETPQNARKEETQANTPGTTKGA